MRPLKEGQKNAVEKRNFTSDLLYQLQDNNTIEVELFKAPPGASEVVVTAVMESKIKDICLRYCDTHEIAQFQLNFILILYILYILSTHRIIYEN